MSGFQGAVSDQMRTRVYKVRLYDVIKDEPRISGRMATEVGAAMMGGHIIEGTEALIYPSQLERGEQWTPIGFKPE